MLSLSLGRINQRSGKKKKNGSQENKMFQEGSGRHMVMTYIYEDHPVNMMVCEENLRARPYRLVVLNCGSTLELHLPGSPCTNYT